MKTKRFMPVAAALTCVLFAVIFLFILTGSTEHPRSDGERLSIQGLRPNEEIVVSTLYSHRSARGREYRIRSSGSERSVAILDTTPAWSRDEGMEGDVAPAPRELSQAEIAGVDEVILYCREVREEISSATRHVRLQYFRDGKQIGEEFYVGFSLPLQLAWYRRGAKRGEPVHPGDYATLADRFGISLDRLYRMVPFETLENDERNPTPL